MAVYYKWIKGCSDGSSLDNGGWTYLKWGKKLDQNPVSALPKLFYMSKKDDDNATSEDNSLGYILTNNVEGVEIEKPWLFKNGIYFNDQLKICSQDEDTITIEGDVSFQNNISTEQDLDVKGNIAATNVTTTGDVTVGSNETVQGVLKVNTKVWVDGGPCEALYFNALSDARAKENIKQANYSAIDIIKKLPIYNYNYKTDSETVTGILAQDLLKAQPEGLNLVSNVNASGRDGDFMSIKNDKLIFILMKAIQEQQEEIELLKQKIDNINNSK